MTARVLAGLAEGPSSGRALAKRLGVRWSPLFAAIRQLVAEGAVVVEGRGRSCRYRLAGAA